MIHLILLAAGNSRRFGSNKLYFPFQGKPLYRHTLDKLIQAASENAAWDCETPPAALSNCHVYTVTQDPGMLQELEEIRDALAIGSRKPPVYLHPVFSPDSEKGISYSIRAGLECAMETEVAFGRGQIPALRKTFFFFFTTDQPYLRTETIIAFLRAAVSSGKPLGCVSHGGEPGNPAYFNASFCSRLRRLTGDTGGRKILHAHIDRCFFYEVSDEKELADADTPEFFDAPLNY